MADVITRLKVDSKEYDSKIKRAESGLLSLENSLKKAGKDFTQADKSAVQFARDLGKMETVSRSARGKVGELSTAFIDLSSQYKRLTDAEKQSPFGKAMAKSLDELKQRVRSAKSELDQFQGELNNTTRKGGNLGGMIDGIAGRFGMSSQMFTAAGAAVAGAGLAFKLAGDNIRTALNFEKSMSMLSSLTGKTGQDLETLKEYAIELGSTSTLTASQVADAFRLIGSQQPQLLESSEALKEVTKNAITLSEAAGIELATAAQTLSVSVNQMGGDSSNAARFVNVLAAASQKGAGDIAWLGEAITKSGTTAKAVGTSYEELVANLEQLAKAGYDASTAGTALRSIIMNLEKKASNEFKPSIVGLTQAFENLGKANLTLTEYQEMAGKMFAAQAKALAEAAGEAKNMKEQITGTNIAEEQAKTNTDNLDGALKSLASAWEGLNLHINSSNGVLKVFIDWCASTIRSLDSMATAAGRAKRALLAMNGGEGGAPTAVDKQISALQGSGYKKQRYTLAVGNYDKQIADLQTKIDNGGKWESSTKPGFYHYESTKVLQARLDALKQMRNEYVTRAKEILNPQKMAEDIGPTGLDEVPGTTSGGGKKGKGGKGGGVTHVMTEEQTISKQIQTLTQEYINATDERKTAIRSEIATLQERQKVIQQMKDEALGKTYTPVVDVLKQLKTEYKITVDDAEVLSKLKDIEGVHIDPKSFTITADDAEALNKLKDIEGVHIDPKSFTITADDAEVLSKLKDIEGVHIDSKSFTITADDAEALNKLKDIEGVHIDPKSFTITVDDAEVLSKLKDIEGVHIDPKSFTITADDAEALSKLKDIEGVHIDPKSFTITADDAEVLNKLKDIEGMHIDPKSFTITADDAEVLSKMKDIEGVHIDPKSFTITADDAEALLKVREIEGIHIDDKSFTITADNAEALNKIKEMEGVSITRTAGIGVSLMGSMDLSVPIISVMSPLESMNKELERTQDLMKKAASPEEWAILADHLEEVKQKVEDFKGNNAAKKQAKDAQDMLRSWQAAAGAVSSVGGALQQIEDPTAKILGIIAQAIANVALGFAQATAAPATTSAGVFGWIAAAVAGTATMISTIAAIKSATSANFAQGGIVPGSSYSGDNIRAYGLNSGELILSMAQQNTIADRLTSSPMDNLNLSATIDAEQIRLVLNNRGRRTGRGEYIQTNFG